MFFYPYKQVIQILDYKFMSSIFHKFIEVSASKPQQANTFIQFAYMEHDIRKSYKQLKDNKGVQKPNEDFIDYWKQIGKQGRQDQVALYFRWIELLQRAINGYAPRSNEDRQGSLYIKKSIIGKWEMRKVKLSGLTLMVFSKQLREYPLRCFGIRKSKNKEHFSWVMEVLMQVNQSKFKSFHVGTNNIIQYQEWFRDLESRIDQARIEYFQEHIIDKQTPQSQFVTIRQQKIEKLVQKQHYHEAKPKMKTLTELVIDKELKMIEDFDELEVIQQSQAHDILEEESHPNICQRLFPEIDIQRFADNPENGVLIQCQNQHRLYQLDGKIKLFLTINHNIATVFRAISQSHKNWNPQIDVFNVKNKISSQNSILAYQKDKSRGFLYRQRDYLFLRHCFSIQDLDKRKRILMVEKSIDSIHNPPFMSVARGQKNLVWELIGNPEERECLLVVQGVIKGGGYMNSNQDIEVTKKNFKKLFQLETFLKQTSYSKLSDDQALFREKWFVNIKPSQDEQFYSPRQMSEDEENSKNTVLTNEEKDFKEQQKKQSKAKEEQFKDFIKYTSIEHVDMPEKMNNQQLNHNISSQQLATEYIPPQLAADKTVVISNQFIKIRHKVEPRPKGKQLWSPSIRGHHLWKGQWAVSQNGGLLYVDEVKMNEQKKVLTFIIKRIGKNILSGKGILNISLPVDIFCRESNIERLAMSFGYCPKYFEKVANAKDPLDQLKAVLASNFGSSLIYLTMQKPFNPILGETYQAWIDGCPVYFQQISHHPPIAAYLMKGRGYEISGTVQAKMDLSINSGTGINEGIFTVVFENGRKFHFTTPPGELSGLTYGERKLCMVDKTYFWNIEEGLFLELIYNPLSKLKGFFGSGGKNLVGQQRLADYFEGTLKKYKPEELRDFFTPKKNDSRKLMIIPKGQPNIQVLGEVAKIWGRWTKYAHFNDERIFDIDKDLYFVAVDEKNPLPSNCNFREDIVYRRLNNFVTSQQFKQVLQVKQRKDRKLREDFKKKSR